MANREPAIAGRCVQIEISVFNESSGGSRSSQSIGIEITMQTSMIERRAILLAVPLLVMGCSAAPSRNILGSFFPSWMICAMIGIGLSIVVRWILVKLGVEKELPAPVVVYMAFTIAFSFAAWLLWLA